MSPSLTSQELTALVVVVVLAVVGVGMLLFLLQKLRRRKAQLLDELKSAPELIQDRAFNRLAMARREAELLHRQGVDVERARERIAEAQASFDARHFDQAYRTAQVAHESLVHARREGSPLPSGGRSTAPPKEDAAARPPRPSSTAPSVPGNSPTPAPPLAKSRAEAQFQLRILDQQLETLPAHRPGPAAPEEAQDLATRAHAAFDRGAFPEAFRLSLKGRRALGGPIESLPPSPGGVSPVAGGTTGAPLGVGPEPPDRAESTAAAGRCAKCGHPMLGGDTFCRGCGTPRVPAVCPQCGAVQDAADSFCGKCGARYS